MTHRSMLRGTLIAAVLVTVGLLIAPTTAGAQYGGQVTVSCSPTTVSPGGAVNCGLAGFAGTSLVTCTIGGATLGSTTSDADGAGSVAGTVPTSAAGTSLAVSCSDGTNTGGTTLVLQATAAPVAPATPLPVTGSDSVSLAQVALVLIAAGGLILLAVRRRQTKVEEPMTV